ncbi:tyrosine-type recombinase/integrase [Sporosarcina koreensis]|uniref:Tyrosine-type recombinase/integrase n=1 Tax=Sporosarcina koreensis TaxID=334735 RepID=A0ABW0TUI3_9BACL
MGTIIPYKKKDGKTYFMIKFYVGVDPLTGKERDTTRRGFKTKSEARTALGRIELEISEGTFRKPRVETYQDVYDLWVNHYERTVEESTYVKTIGIFRNHILPALGSSKIDKIDLQTAQEAVDKWANVLKNFRMVKAYASKVFDYAIKYDYIQKNPFSLVELTIKKNKIRLDDGDEPENFYTKDQLLEFLNCMKKETNVKAYVLFHLLAFTGMRKGEALALTWRDIDFTKNSIRIKKAISRGKNNHTYLKTTKTGVTRTIKMYPETISILKEWEVKQREENKLLGFNKPQPNQLVFNNERNEFLQPTKTRKWLEHVLNKYDLPKITTHGFRHTHCSLMFEAGATILEVQDRLGHSDVKTTMNIYAHVSNEAKDGAVSKLETYMTR